MRFNNFKFNKQEGQSLVEMLIAMSIFVIFIVIAVGGFIQTMTNQRIVLKLSAATDNMSFSLEQMMREIRVGNNFNVYDNGQSISFNGYDENGNQENIIYSLNSSTGAIDRTFSIPASIPAINVSPSTAPLTANNVTVSYFNVSKYQPHNPGPALITIVIGVTASDRGVSITNYIQTSVSSRAF